MKQDIVGNSIQSILEAKKWWSSLSMNEQRQIKNEVLGKDFPTCSVYTNSNLIRMHEAMKVKVREQGIGVW
jgi:hypothetical protein